MTDFFFRMEVQGAVCGGDCMGKGKNKHIKIPASIRFFGAVNSNIGIIVKIFVKQINSFRVVLNDNVNMKGGKGVRLLRLQLYPRNTWPLLSMARIVLHSEHRNLPAFVAFSFFEQIGHLNIFGKTFVLPVCPPFTK